MISISKYLKSAYRLALVRKLIGLICLVFFTLIFGQNCSPPGIINSTLHLRNLSSTYDRFFINSNTIHSFSTSSSAASGLVGVQANIESVDSVGVFLNAAFAQGTCANRAVKIDMYLKDSSGTPQFQNQCFANAASTNSFPTKAYCYFRQPLAAGTDASKILLRYWKITTDCANYADDNGRAADGFQDQFLAGRVSSAKFYQGLTNQSLISIIKPNYNLKLDRNGGATYEFYNKRASINDSSFLSNALHSHSGAALQIAFHDHTTPTKLIADSCDPSQGYWNPTQAGFYCAFMNGQVETTPRSPTAGDSSGLNITCDGQENNNCTAAADQVLISEHRMMNWDYGASYPGPFNNLDLAFMSQQVDATDDFVTYGITFTNRGQTMKGPLEIPTFYFTNNFRKYYYKAAGQAQVNEVTIPLRTTNANSFKVPDNNQELEWITFENNSGVKNDVYTLAWFYGDEFAEDLSMSGFGIVETEAYKAIKFTNEPIFTAVQNKTYHFKYVVFPFKFNEVINSKFGRLAVVDVIAKLKNEFNCSNCSVRSTVNASLPPVNGGWTSWGSCSAQCGPGQQARSCTNPLPTNGGQNCSGVATQNCNVATCTSAADNSPKIYKFVSANSPFELWPATNAIDNSTGTSFSSTVNSSAQNEGKHQLEAHFSELKKINKLKISARMLNGTPLGFPRTYNIYVTSENNGSWVNQGTFEAQPNANGTATIPLSLISTYGILIVPIELGQDNLGDYYFQISELEAEGI